ncbi:MAG TPA: hypothetical protein VMR02_16040 [Terracidiphilus sp.]|jgi:hypothetical protein|nr:hypothetical protein [Terracidiphilus sp.]
MTPNSWSPLESSARRGVHCTRKSLAAWLVRTAHLILTVIGVLSLSSAGLAQQASSANGTNSSAALPDAPQSAQSPAQKASDPNVEERLPQTKRILGIIPNFRSVSTDETLPPQSVKDKIMEATQDSFDYSSIIIPGVIAAYSMASDAYPEFHQGAAGYARYFWHSAVDQTSENYMVEFIVPVITREDTRYYTLGRGGFAKRTGYALSRVVITRTDAGNETFNISEVVGAGASAGLSSLYYPSRERSFSNTASEWGVDLGIDAASFLAREFWPDINRHVFHGKNAIDSKER